jgi:hypothetical protein
MEPVLNHRHGNRIEMSSHGAIVSEVYFGGLQDVEQASARLQPAFGAVKNEERGEPRSARLARLRVDAMLVQKSIGEADPESGALGRQKISAAVAPAPE